eukprot:NODE_11791_length_296_cov_11.198381_g10878_i0.p4 GENE.NODE_11791_length_296_cov_11.198381_g10878_i0~~NODE_11791_length_296_cov_11.198381_g10878_i0.p4  ORF type:complete len:62 (-),score=21.54 NODE_11791_length_296_cov_11.198381_g10878_i0:110-274(-)
MGERVWLSTALRVRAAGPCPKDPVDVARAITILKLAQMLRRQWHEKRDQQAKGS